MRNRKDDQITISLPQGYKNILESIAFELDCTWGDRPSVARLLRAIAEGAVVCERGD